MGFVPGLCILQWWMACKELEARKIHNCYQVSQSTAFLPCSLSCFKGVLLFIHKVKTSPCNTTYKVSSSSVKSYRCHMGIVMHLF